MKNFEKDGFTYFELYAACPICYEREKHGAAEYWSHHGCGGQIYIGDNAMFYCDKCKEECQVEKCKIHTDCHHEPENINSSNIPLSDHQEHSNTEQPAINEPQSDTPEHSNSGLYEIVFAEGNPALSSVIAIAGQLVSAIGVPWLQKFLQNLR
ncbi:MAG: hypothetical protein LBL07_00605 [Tannerella sp.]|jgi:hypothetical protein|nr:hypothetical protein [Tannerella sp.]